MLAPKAAVLTILVLWGGMFSAQQTVPEVAESYAVYSALIPQIQEVAQSKYLIADQTIPYTRTKSRFPVDPENIVTIEEFKRRLQQARGTPAARTMLESQPCILPPEVELRAYYSAMVDYRRANEVSLPLERRFDLQKGYELVNVSGLVRDKKLELARKSGAYGVYEVSAVGFSSDMTVAIVYVGFDCSLCDRRALHVLKKMDGTWKEVASGCNVLS